MDKELEALIRLAPEEVYGRAQNGEYLHDFSQRALASMARHDANEVVVVASTTLTEAWKNLVNKSTEDVPF